MIFQNYTHGHQRHLITPEVSSNSVCGWSMMRKWLSLVARFICSCRESLSAALLRTELTRSSSSWFHCSRAQVTAATHCRSRWSTCSSWRSSWSRRKGSWNSCCCRRRRRSCCSRWRGSRHCKLLATTTTCSRVDLLQAGWEEGARQDNLKWVYW